MPCSVMVNGGCKCIDLAGWLLGFLILSLSAFYSLIIISYTVTGRLILTHIHVNMNNYDRLMDSI